MPTTEYRTDPLELNYETAKVEVLNVLLVLGFLTPALQETFCIFIREGFKRYRVKLLFRWPSPVRRAEIIRTHAFG